MSKKIILVMGTRPEIIKMLPVKQALESRVGIVPIIVSSGQQRELSRQTFAAFGVTPDVDLDVMTHNQSLPKLTASLVTKLADTIKEIGPHAVLVHGDTTTAFAASLAAFYSGVDIGHVEAGLRTYDFSAPWPEEMNRRLIDPLCRWCFVPTPVSAANLRAERVPESHIYVTGNTVIDALLQKHRQLIGRGSIAADIGRKYGMTQEFITGFLEQRSSKPLVLVTGHRRESFGPGFEEICLSIRALADRHRQVGIVYPVHLNPNVGEPVRRLLSNHERIQLIPPVDYDEFILLMAKARFILTDSGGIQEEAPSLGKPVLVMRDTTERPEGVSAGTCRLVGTSKQRILAEAELLLSNDIEYAKRSSLHNPYGDGRAAQRIAEVLSGCL